MTNTAIFQVTQTERRIAFTLSLPRLGRRRTTQAAAPDWPGRPFGPAECAYLSQLQCR